MATKIEWAQEVWNPIIGCSKVSAGCRNCYAERMANRLAHMGVEGYDEVVAHSGKWAGKTVFVKSQLEKPLHLKKPRRIFVCSMGDLFHESVPDEWLNRVFDVIQRNPQHKFILLTKRPRRMADYINHVFAARVFDLPFWLTNVWAGVTVESQDCLWRVKELGRLLTAVRFVSVEPMLGPVRFSRPLIPRGIYGQSSVSYSTLFNNIDWVICGGESGPGARLMHPDWARDLRDECRAAGVPFFFKQWGEYCHPDQMPEDTYSAVDAAHNLAGYVDRPWKVGRKKAGRLLDGEMWDQFPAQEYK